jgi:SAM-dependent methyltransferase|tara:strand:+ start:542 stop:1234 length:693 start_codon:yes stop_codon:yes gene_type:complete
MKDYLNNSDITRIYREYVLKNNIEDYKYVPLPIAKNINKWRWENKDFPRVISLLEFQEFFAKNNYNFEKVLCFNGDSDPEFEFLPYKTKKIIHYETDPTNNDLHNLNLLDKDYDFCMLNQTLEHLYDPILCLKNINSHLKKGGIFYCNLPVINIPHMTPLHHYTGFTPTGLGCIAEAAGFEIISLGSWGNKEYILKLFEELTWPSYQDLINPGLNQKEYPVISWIFGRKK